MNIFLQLYFGVQCKAACRFPGDVFAEETAETGGCLSPAPHGCGAGRRPMRKSVKNKKTSVFTPLTKGEWCGKIW